jgi:hypothetical protein
VLALDPDHARAREKLARLSQIPDDEPDDAFFGPAPAARPRTPAAPPPPRPKVAAPLPPPVPAGGQPPSFEAFAASSSDADDPFAPAHAHPFVAGDTADPFAAPGRGPVDPFAGTHAQPPGTGDQPEWGPGLAYVKDAVGAGGAADARPKPPRPRRPGETLSSSETIQPKPKGAGIETAIGIVVIGFALIVLVGLGAFLAQEQGWLDGGKPSMTRTEESSFSIEHPKQWDVVCKADPSGYPVCGIANHPFYNQVDWYLGGSVDFGSLFTSLGNGLLFNAPDLPDIQVSVIVMDVPTTSPAYNGSSWAKTKNDWAKEGWLVSSDAKTKYEKKEITVDGLTAYYYHFESEDPVSQQRGFYGRDVVYDVYIPHDNLMLWMTVTIIAPIRKDVPDDTIQEMIRSIDIK